MDKHKIKKYIETLISNEDIVNAKELIKECIRVWGEDVDIITMKSVINIIEQNYSSAKEELIYGLNTYGEQYDLLYNLAYIYDLENNKRKAYHYYLKALKLNNDNKNNNELQVLVNELSNNKENIDYINRKKILIAAYIFPPLGGSGVQRTLKFVKYLRDYGYEPIVVTTDNSLLGLLEDTTLENEIPKDIEIIRVKEESNYGNDEISYMLKKYENIINNNDVYKEYIENINYYNKKNESQIVKHLLMLPDECSLWSMDVIKVLDKRVDFNNIDVIYTTSGPYSDHLIGYFLKEKYEKNWVADFRDEWTNNPYIDFNKETLDFEIIKCMENEILQKCDKLITTTPLARENYINLLGVPKNKVVCITNGYDEEDFKDIYISNLKNKKFTITHNGMFYMVRNPITFLHAIKNLIISNEIDKAKIKINFSYTEGKEEIEKFLLDNDMSGIVKFNGYMPHKDSISCAINSDLLLLVVGEGEKNKGVYTGKIFEYLRMKKNILALSPCGSIVEDLLKETNSGKNFDYNDVEGIQNYIKNMYDEWNGSIEKVYVNNANIEQYDRKNLTIEIANIFKSIESEKERIKKFKDEKEAIKEYIRNLIKKEEYFKVEEIIDEYSKIIKNDNEIYSLKAISLIKQGNVNRAKRILNNALKMDTNNFDLNYAMAFLYESLNEYNESLFYYNNALNVCVNDDLKKQLENNINNICNTSGLKQFKYRKKLVFFCIENGDKFLRDIIEILSKKYYVKKIVVNKAEQIDGGMQWADICWFEWCDSLISYGSKHNLASKKNIICRLHRYEVFTENPENVNWDNVNKLIVVTDHLEKLLLKQIPKLNEKVDIITIKNGVDLERYELIEREKGYNLAYVGYIDFRKNPTLLLQIINKLIKKDKRYKLFVAGKFTEPLLELFWNYQIEEMGLKDNIIFDGWQNDISTWMQDKNYIISTTIHESFGYGIAEAMARGIKPIINNFLYSKEIWDEKYIFNTVDEACEMVINDEYNSLEYRDFIKEKYALEKQINEIEKLIEEIIISAEINKKNNIYEFKHDGNKIKFYLPNASDYVPSVIIENSNFYEFDMLNDIKKRLPKESIVLDIGANIGNHSVFLGQICKCKKIYSFEPQKNIFSILSKNIELNNLSNNCVLYNKGLGKEFSYANINIIDSMNLGMSKLEKNDNGIVQIDTLDNIIENENINRLDMIKIDVEGMEMDVLEGAYKVISKYKPIIYVEAATKQEYEEVNNYLNRLGYKMIDRFNYTPTYLFISQ